MGGAVMAKMVDCRSEDVVHERCRHAYHPSLQVLSKNTTEKINKK